MTTEQAWVVLAALASTAAVGWVITAIGFVRLVSPRREDVPGYDKPPRFSAEDGPAGGPVVTGRVEVAGRPEELAQKLAEALGRGGLSGLLTRVVDRTRDRVIFEVVGPSPGVATGRGPSASRFGRPVRGEVVFSSAGSSHARGDYAIGTTSGRGAIVVGTVLLVAGLAAVVGLFVALKTYALPSTNPSVRTQVVQMVQCVHLIWPPWLCAIVYRRGQDTLRTALEVLIGNLPYV